MLLALAKRVGLQDADAQDVVGTTLGDFTQAYRDGKYDRTRGRLRDWLKGILRNNISRHFSRISADAKRLERCGQQISEESRGPALLDMLVESVDEATDREWQLDLLNEALTVLRQECQVDTYQAFDLYAIKQWPARKVAEFLKVPINTVHQAKSRSLARLRAIVARLEREEE
jgi:RNA polymerase sigma factor (sigma-70 family)